MKLLKRLMSSVVTLCVLSSAFYGNIHVYADETASAESTDAKMASDIEMGSNSSLGKIIADAVADSSDSDIADEERKSRAEFSVSSIDMEYGSAYVKFTASGDALLTVALYDEETGQMVTSASTDIAAGDTETVVTFDVMPESYYIAKGFIIDKNDCAPLSEVFENTLYTQEKQEFYGKTYEDFPEERVLMLDENSTYDFAVFDEGVHMAEYTEGVNTVVTNDNENGVYVIENPDKGVSALESGDILVLYYGEAMPLIVKIDTITCEDELVTITAADAAIDEIFEYFRYSSGYCEPDYGDVELEEGVSIEENTVQIVADGVVDSAFLTLTKEEAESEEKKEDDVSQSGKFDYTHDGDGNHKITYTHSITVDMAKKKWTKKSAPSYLSYDSSAQATGTIKGTITCNLSAALTINMDKDHKGSNYVAFEVTSDLKTNLEISGNISADVQLLPKEIEIPLKLDFYITMKPYLTIEGNASMTANTSYKAVLGYSYDESRSEPFSEINEKDTTGAAFRIEGSFYIGINLNPSVNWINEHLFSIDVEQLGAGVLISGKLWDASGEITSEDEWFDEQDAAISTNLDKTKTEKHLCKFKFCIDGEVQIQFKIKVQLKIFKITNETENKGPSFTLTLPKYHIKYFHIPLSEGVMNGAWKIEDGKCDNKSFLCYIKCRDSDTGHYLNGEDISVRICDSSGNDSIVEEDENGNLYVWLKPGKYSMRAQGACYDRFERDIELAYRSIPKKNNMNINDEEYVLFVDNVQTQTICCDLVSYKHDITVNIADENGTAIENAVVICSYTSDVVTHKALNTLVLSDHLLSTITYTAASAMMNHMFGNYPDVETKLSPSSTLYKLPDGTYSFQVICPGFETQTFYIDVKGTDSEHTLKLEFPEPEVPKVNGKYSFGTSVNDVQFAITWNAVEKARKYEFRYIIDDASALEDGEIITVDSNVLRSSDIPSLQRFDSDITYQVRAVCNYNLKDVESEWSEPEVWNPCDFNVEIHAEDENGYALSDVKYTIENYAEISTSNGTMYCVLPAAKYKVTAERADYNEETKSFSMIEGEQETVSFALEPKVLLAEGECGDNLYWELSSNNVLTIYGSGEMYDYMSYLRIPWYDYKTSIYRVRIKPGVTSIGENAFCKCNSISEVVLPNTIRSIGGYAFGECYGLITIELPEGLTELSSSVFYRCLNLIRFYIPKSMTSIESQLMGGYNDSYYIYYSGTMSDWQSVTVEDTHLQEATVYYGEITESGITGGPIIASGDGWELGSDGTLIVEKNISSDEYPEMPWSDHAAFIKSAELSHGITNVNDNMFSGCGNMASVSLPNGITRIGNNAFTGCESLTSVSLPDTVTAVGSFAFSGCDSLTSVSLPDSIAVLGSYAFSGCEGLTSLSLPQSLNCISDFTFHNCYNIEDITLPDSVTEIGRLAFWDCMNLKQVTIPDSVTTIGSYAFKGCQSLTEITIPDSVLSIGDGSFSGCKSLTEIIIPDSVTDMGGGLFYSCESLKSVDFPENMTSFDSNSAESEGFFENCSSLESIVIPDSVTSIGDSCFKDCESLKSITIGKGVTYVGIGAFDNCTALDEVNINDIDAWFNIEFESSSSQPLAEGAGLYLNGVLVQDVCIPDTVTEVKDYVFYGYQHLKTLRIPSSVTAIGGCAFYKCDALEILDVEDIGAWCSFDFNYGDSNPLSNGAELYINNVPAHEIILPEGVTEIKSHVFEGAATIESVIIPNTVTTICAYSFSECKALTHMEVPDSVTSIGMYAFSHCEELTSVSIGNSVEAIPGYAFYYCKNLREVSIGDSVTEIDYHAFEGCSSLTEIDLGQSMKLICNNAFSNSGLVSISVPISLTEVERYAFDGCDALTTVYYEGDIEQWYDIEISRTGNDALRNDADIICNSSVQAAVYSVPLVLSSVEGNMTARFEGLVDGAIYNFYCVKNYQTEEMLENDNILYMDQVQADLNGTATVTYNMRMQYEDAVIFLVSVSGHHYGDVSTYNDTIPVIRLNVGQTAVMRAAGEHISTDDAIVEVDKNGEITAKETGTAAILLRCGDEMKILSVIIVSEYESATVNKGDVDGDGNITISDATIVLTMYAQNAAGLSTAEYTDSQKKAADADENGVIEINDATAILTYYAQNAAGLNPAWDKILA